MDTIKSSPAIRWPRPFCLPWISLVLRRVLLLLLVLKFGGFAFADRPNATMPEQHRRLIKKFCFDCHNQDSKEGQVDLQNLSFDLATLETAELWQKVLGALNSGEMPPADEPQLPNQAKSKLLEDLSGRLVIARKILSDSGGVITMRRLNRREYSNTLRDLLGAEVSVADLPSDANSGGFDTAGASLFFSSDQFEQYLTIARRALQDVLASGPRPKTTRKRIEAEKAATKTMKNRARALEKKLEKILAFRQSDKPPTDFGFIDEARVEFEQGQYDLNYPFLKSYLEQSESKTGALLVTSFLGSYVVDTPLPKQPGQYVLRVRAGRLPNGAERPQFLEFGHNVANGQLGELKVVGCRQVTGTIEEPQTVEIPFAVSDQTNIGVRERQPNSRDYARKIYRAARAKNGVGPKPSLWIDWVELEGPILPSWPTKWHKSIFFADQDRKKDREYAREVIARFAKRAFRQKNPSESFVDRLVGFYESGREQGMSFEDAMVEPLAIVLSSPSFLYLSEPNESKETRKLNDRELAVRLAYFLWSAPPDDELYELASQGRLSDAKVLAEQTDRMIKDTRADEFVSGFAHQWLDMERLDFFQFNLTRFPEFDESVKESARQEIYHTIATILRQSMGIKSLLKSDFVVINDLLADYYGIRDVRGSQFRLVDLPIDSPRGGLLGTAAVMAMGSDGERSSPVERGAWVMRKLLHDPPPPAPANVPQLNRLEGKRLSAREMQKAHMEEPQCSQCHDKIDPLGFGLQNFDAVGKWRTKELIEQLNRKGRVVERKSHAIDSSGTMPNGKKFAGYFQLRERVAEYEDDFARGLAEALIEYGLGRPYGFTDYDLCESILASAKRDKNKLSAFIHALIQSEQFSTK